MPPVARPCRLLIPLLALAACSSEVADEPQPEANIPRLAEQPSDDDLEGVTPPFLVQWSFEDLVGDWGDLTLPITLKNHWNTPLEAEVLAWVRVPGIDEDTEVEIPLTSGSFDPFETVELALPTEALPPLVPGLPVEVRIVTRVLDQEQEGTRTVSASPRLVELDADLETVSVYPRKRYESLADALYDASRPFFAEQYAESPLEAPLAADAPPSAGPLITTDVRVCAEWRVGYEDNEGETLLNSMRQQRVPASFARLVVVPRLAPFQPFITGEPEIDEYLDENGCAELQPLAYGDHVMAVYSEFERDGLRIDVEWDDEPMGMEVYDPSWSGGAFRVSGPGDIHRLTGNDDQVTRTAAVISRALTEPDLPLDPAGFTIKFYANETCPTSGATACATKTKVHIGQKDDVDGTRFRNLIAHEFGHLVQYRGSQRFALNLSQNYDQGLPQVCSCRHLPPAPYGPSHCLQSVEQASFAFGEGFGHFVAARLFNINPFGCEFQYYKPLWRSPTDTAPAPVTMRCDIPPLWELSHGCVREGDDVEYDWLAFFWAINHAPAEQRWSMQEMFEVLSAPCDDVDTFGHCRLDWAWLESAVNASSLSAAKKNRFLDTALVYGLVE